MSKKTVRDIDLKEKKVIERCDFNVPLLEDGTIRDNTRIVAALPTIKYLLEQNCAVILCSHLGRPKGQVVPEMSLAPVAKELSKLLGQEVKLAKDVVGEDAQKLAKELKPGEVMLLENVRFEPGEEKEVDLVMVGGTERIFGFNGLTEAQINEDTLLPSLENAKLRKFI